MTQHDPSRALSRRDLWGMAVGLAAAGVVLADASGGTRVVPIAVALVEETSAGPPRPEVLGCEGWDARDPSVPVTVLDRRPEKIIVHHTATRNREVPLALATLARAIQDFHMDTNDWIDSGHHFLVDRSGLVAEGRHRSMEALLDGQRLVEGSHCPDQNDRSIGIENEGTYSEADPPAALLAGLRALCAFTCQQYGLRATQLYGHRDFRDTACPGDRLYALLPSLRRGVATLLRTPDVDSRAIAHPPTWPLLRIADRGPRVLAAQHLLRSAGVPGVPADGRFERATADGVYAFQRQHGLELTGMIGGGSWPLLAVPVRSGQGGEAELAVRALLAGGPARQDWTVPDTVTAPAWQRLLGTG